MVWLEAYMKIINDNEFYTVKVTQYLLPDGRLRQVTTELPIESKQDYLDMLKADCRLEAEMLRSGLISVTITNKDEDVDIEVITNGHEVQKAYVKMLNRRLWEKEDDRTGDNFPTIN